MIMQSCKLCRNYYNKSISGSNSVLPCCVLPYPTYINSHSNSDSDSSSNRSWYNFLFSFYFISFESLSIMPITDLVFHLILLLIALVFHLLLLIAMRLAH
jgi:hypothetical protein